MGVAFPEEMMNPSTHDLTLFCWFKLLCGLIILLIWTFVLWILSFRVFYMDNIPHALPLRELDSIVTLFIDIACIMWISNFIYFVHSNVSQIFCKLVFCNYACRIPACRNDLSIAGFMIRIILRGQHVKNKQITNGWCCI